MLLLACCLQCYLCRYIVKVSMSKQRQPLELGLMGQNGAGRRLPLTNKHRWLGPTFSTAAYAFLFPNLYSREKHILYVYTQSQCRFWLRLGGLSSSNHLVCGRRVTRWRWPKVGHVLQTCEPLRTYVSSTVSGLVSMLSAVGTGAGFFHRTSIS